MAITYVGSDADSQNVTSFTLDWTTAGGGSAPALNDFAVLSWNGQAGLTWTAPAGFTLLNSTDASSGTHRGRIYYRVCDGTESGTVTLTHSAINKHTGILAIYRGVDPTTPISDWDVRDETVAGTTHANPQVTTGTADEAVLTLIHERVTASTVNYTAPASYTKRVQPAPEGGGGSTSAALADDGLAVSRSAGTNVTPGTWSNGTSTANVLTWTLSLQPASTSTAKAGTDSGTLTEGTTALDAASTATDSGTLTEAKTLTADTAASDSGTLTESAELAVTGEPEFRVRIDWDGDGTFDDAGEDVTDRVLAAGGLTTSFGRDQARAVAPPKTGEAAFQLNNLSRDYSPDNTGSPLADDLLPAREILAEVELNGTDYTLFRGHIDDFDVKVDHGGHSGAVSRVDVTALDPLAKLRGAKVSTELYQGIRTGAAIGYILDAVGWPPGLRDLDPGGTLIRWWCLQNEDAWDALMKLIGSEGPGAIVHANEDGGITFRDRHHRLLNTASTVTQAVITDGADGYEPAFSSMSYDHGWRDIINSVSMTVDELDPSDEPEEIWSTPTAYTLDAGGSVTIEIETSDPIKVASASPSYSYSGGPVTADWVRNSAQSISLTLTAGGSGAHITDLKMLGQPVQKRRSYTVTHTDPASITKYGVRSPTSTIDAPWAGLYDATAIAELIIGARAERSPVVTVEFRGVHKNVRLVEQIGRDLSDRIHVTETQTGLDADMFLEQIKHTVLPGGFVNTVFGLEKAAQQAEGVFRFDDAAHGFNDGVFAAAGLDDPDTLFIFDQAGHGFNDGVFAT